mmetsp:Transcript_34552/g.25661  ORF Transcript_34552/g.25661 Transcript_34552/m.25661 type:complete len:141 (-) Transcript_34552:22-444(-)
MSEAAAYYNTALFFEAVIQQLDASVCPNIKKHLRTALRIYAAHSLMRFGGMLVTSGYMKPAEMVWMQESLLGEYVKFRPQMLNLAEGFVMNDATLFSTIGCEDGNFYEKMLKVAKTSRLNDQEGFEGFWQHLRPLMATKL